MVRPISYFSFFNLISPKLQFAVRGNLRLLLQNKTAHFYNIVYVPLNLYHPTIMKLSTPEFKSILTPELDVLVKLFERHKYEIRIAGGAVRDLLLEKVPKDIDFATTATPEQMKEIFELENIRLINMKGEKHGTITARIGDQNFEVTTLRIDRITNGRHAEVEFTKDWELDANRRDLTINSMFLDVEGVVYDYFGGMKDLEQRKLLFVGDADKRIKEDYLRILRYFRFYGRISKTPNNHDEVTIKAITENISGLQIITGERIWMELGKILSGNYVCSIVKKLISVGASPFIGFPTSPNITELEIVWERAQKLKMHPVTILTSLMNDCHEFIKFHERCKLSTYDRNLGLFIIQYRSSDLKPLKFYQALLFRTDGKPTDIKEYIIELLKYRGNIEKLDQFKSWSPPKLPINGHLLKERKVPLGKVMGKVMKKCKDYWIDNDFKPTQEELLEKVPTFLDELQ